jgi:alcohol dehydrogenase class IV
MALAALLSGIALANAGLGAVHGFAAPLGANLPIPHGTVCAALLPHVMAANVDALLAESADHPALRRYATIGKTLSRQGDMPDTVAIESAIQIVSELTVRLRIPRLNSFGLTSEKISVLAELAEKASSMRYNPVVLSQQTLCEILEKAM